MENINSEKIISSLFNKGFDKVDNLLFTYTLGKILLEDKNKEFIYEDKEHSKVFEQYIEYNGLFFKTKDGYSLNTNISPTKEINWPIKKALLSSRKLNVFIDSLDFNELILKKFNAYGLSTIEEANLELFSQKEIVILNNIMNKKNKTKTLKN